MALPCNEYIPVNFVDRDDDFLKLTNLTASLPLPTRSQRIVLLVGNSNIGKTSLLCKFFNHLVDLGIFWPVFISLKDFKDYSGNRFAIEILSKLYHSISIAYGLPQDQTLDANTPADFNLKVVDELLSKTPGDQPVILLFDEVSMLSTAQLKLFEDYFLKTCINLPKVLVVLAGRYQVTTWKNFDLRPRQSLINNDDSTVRELKGFEPNNSEKQISSLEEKAIVFTSKIHSVSGGSPGYNRRIVEQLIRNNFQFDELAALQACNEELYAAVQAAGNDLPPEQARELLPALEALCVLLDFDKDYEAPLLLAAHEGLQGEWTAKRSSELLQNLSRIHVGAGKLVDWNGQDAYVVEEEARRTFEMELKLRNRALWTKLHTTAKEMYDEWVRKFPPGEVFVGKSNYHSGRLSEKDQ